MKNLVLAGICALTLCGQALATELTSDAASELQDVVQKIHHSVAIVENENYDDSAAAYAVSNEFLSPNLTKITRSSRDAAFAKCLYFVKKDHSNPRYTVTSANYDRFQSKINSLVASFGDAEWFSDISLARGEKQFDLILGNATTTLDNKLTPEHALAQSGDEYGGAGGYWPHCSIVVKTSSGISFVFHAIDTY